MENAGTFWEKVIAGKKIVLKKGSVCLHNCKIPVVREVSKSMCMKTVNYTNNWDLCWCDTPMDVKRAKEMKKYQKTNHFPGMSEICRKDSLARNLNAMMNCYPDEYNFFPKTWYLPSDYSKLQTYSMHHRSATYILKPSTGCRGTGIYLEKYLKNINQTEKIICQMYITRPLLLDGYKFDMRVYTLISSCDPLKIYVYNDGLVRLATERYRKPSEDNFKNLFMHLTNYSVNKHSLTYIDDEISGSKRRIAVLNEWLNNKGYDVGRIWEKIDDVIVKTIILAYPFVHRSYQSCFSGHRYRPACFEILGFDILLDENCKPHLLEVNHSPDFHTDTAIDQIVKQALLADTFQLLQLDKSFKKIVSGEEKWKIGVQIRQFNKHQYKEKLLACKKYFHQENDKWESENMGNYRLVFSEKNSRKYEHFFYCNENSLYRNTVRPMSRQESWKELRNKFDRERTQKKPAKFVVSSTPVIKGGLKNNHYSKDGVKEHDIEVGAVSNANKSLKNEKQTASLAPHRGAEQLISKNLRLVRSLNMESSSNRSLVQSGERPSNVLDVRSNGSSSLAVKYQNTRQYNTGSSSRQDDGVSGSNSREKIETIKQMNKSMFPYVQSRLFVKSKTSTSQQDGWKETPIDQVEENARLDGMSNRSDTVFILGVKEQIYKAFHRFNNLYEIDHLDYTEYLEKRIRHGIKPFTFTKINIVFD